jgi:hypothetical protein
LTSRIDVGDEPEIAKGNLERNQNASIPEARTANAGDDALPNDLTSVIDGGRLKIRAEIDEPRT